MAKRDVGDFSEFAVAIRDQLRRTAYLLCGDWDTAADITQEALIRLYVAWPRLEDRGLRTYAHRTVTSVAFDLRRKRSSRELASDQLPDARTEDSAGALAERLLLMQSLAQLPSRQRACVVLRYYADMSVDEVASTLGCRIGTVKSQTARGLTALRTAYTAAGGELVLDHEEVTTR